MSGDRVVGRVVKLRDVAINSTAVSNDPAGEGFERYIIGRHIPEVEERVESWGDVGDSDFGPRIRTIFRPGDVICTTRGPKLKVARVEFDGLGAHTNFVLRTADPGVLIQPYLEALVRSTGFQSHLAANFRGSVNLFVNWSDAAEYEFVLPSLTAQMSVAEALRASEAAVRSLRSLGRNLGNLRSAMIDGLTFSGPRTNETVGAHCQMQNGRPFPGDEYCDEGVRLLRAGNMDSSGYISWSEGSTKRVPAHYLNEASGFVVAPGDVLINLTAQSLEDGFMGRVCLVRKRDESLLNQRIGRFVDYSDDLRPEFLFRVLQTSFFRRHSIGMCEGSKVKHLFWEHVSRFKFFLPSLPVQDQIIQELREVDAAVVEVGQRLEAMTSFNAQLLESALFDVMEPGA